MNDDKRIFKEKLENEERKRKEAESDKQVYKFEN